MKQAGRFFFRPTVFFNQLQWSSSHWFIMIAFFAVAAVETHVGKYSAFYAQFSHIIQMKFGVSLEIALWAVTALKLVALTAGAYLLASFIWVLGNMIGTQRSMRVLFRRLAVVFTVLLLGRTASHLDHLYAWMDYASTALYVWGGFLAFVAIREQFILNLFETAVVAGLAIVFAATSFHLGSNFSEEYAKSQLRMHSSPSGVAVDSKRTPRKKFRH